MIRKAITDCFLTLIHETYKFNGAPELLDILARFVKIILFIILFIFPFIKYII